MLAEMLISYIIIASGCIMDFAVPYRTHCLKGLHEHVQPAGSQLMKRVPYEPKQMPA